MPGPAAGILDSRYASDTAGLLQAVVEVWVTRYVTDDPALRAVFEERYAETYRDRGAATGLPDTFLAAVDHWAN